MWFWRGFSDSAKKWGVQGNGHPTWAGTFLVQRVVERFRDQSSNGTQLDKKKAQSLPEIVKTLVPAKKSDVLELDELWSFVYSKAFKRWVWIALCRRTRQIVAYFIGDRSEKSCRKFWSLVPPKYRKCQSFSDFWEAYAAVIDNEKHQMVGKESGETNHVERWNNTLRQRISRFVRKTLSFSKSDEMHRLYLHLFIFNYNLSLINWHYQGGLLKF